MYQVVAILGNSVSVSVVYAGNFGYRFVGFVKARLSESSVVNRVRAHWTVFPSEETAVPDKFARRLSVANKKMWSWGGERVAKGVSR